MRIVNISPHLYVKGGSDSYFIAQSRLLEEYGFDVAPFCVDSERNLDSPWKSYFTPGVNLINPNFMDIINYCYSFPAKKTLRALLKEFEPNLAHLHIFYGNFTSSILSVLKDEFNIPIVQTVHDYKPVCPVYSLTRDGNICEECNGYQFWRTLQKRCNKNSFQRSALSAIESYISRAFGNISKIDRFIAVSEFQASRLRTLGLPDERLRIIHNFIDAKNICPTLLPTTKPKFLYFGRIEKSKGVYDILAAAEIHKDIQFVVAGTGNAYLDISNIIVERKLDNVLLPGFISGEILYELIRSCTATILIPTVYENCPMSVLESLALGVPVIGSRMGGIPELVSHDNDGIIISSGDSVGLSNAIEKLAHDPIKAYMMGMSGREKMIQDFSAKNHFHKIRSVYEEIDIII
jgi:glycosyltransferase involved in cell wall biosynthesis